MRQKKTRLRRCAALLCAVGLALCLAGCGGAAQSAAAMFLRRTEGTVRVLDAEGQSLEPAQDLGLYSGYELGTEAESYAWIDLDRAKLAKLNENSEAAITKEGKSLTIDIKSGGLFFNVTEPLAEDETMEIRSSSLLVGIRGTCGWMSKKMIGLLEGAVTVTAGEQSVAISAGEYAILSEEGALEVRELTYEMIPAYAAREILEDEALEQAVWEASGLRIPTTNEELLEQLEDVVYSEQIDFEGDGSPELLVIMGEGRFAFRICRVGPQGAEYLVGGVPVAITNVSRYACELVERDGRQFIHLQTDGSDMFGTGVFMDTYFGSVAAQDGGRDDWGMTDYLHQQGEARDLGLGWGAKWVGVPNEKGFVEDMNNTQQVWEEWDEYRDKYTPVRTLYETAGDL